VSEVLRKGLAWRDVLLRPVVTEKTLKRSERQNTYTFEVREDANKVQIRQAVEHLFKVKVLGVRTQRYLGKRRRVLRAVGLTPPWKKAIVQVKAGQTIEVV
jgi:large subunit ribosomal protein L23